jgi:hypothetical protein
MSHWTENYLLCKLDSVTDQNETNQTTIQSYTETYLVLWSSTLGMCKAVDNQSHPEIPIKNIKGRHATVCEQP